MRNLFIFLLAFISVTLFNSEPTRATSLGVDPLFMEIGTTSASSIKIQNSGDTDVPVEIIIYERVIDEFGNQSKREADDDFIVFPPQAVIPPSGVQNIRFQPIGADNTQSKSYYLTVQQIPVDLGDRPDGMYLNVVFAFDAAVHIVPKGATANAVTHGATPAEMSLDDGETFIPAIEINLENTGNKYLYLQDYKYEISGTDGSGNPVRLNSWTQDDIIKALPTTLVGPTAMRTIKLPVPKDLSGGSYTVTMTSR